jgi:2,4-dienoyl-CoA reductase-like NADH-dependent reductase (Old Yellow Enzyme family)
VLHLKNNSIIAPVKTGYSGKTGFVTEKHLSFYGERSRYLGAVTPDLLYIPKV